jgi:hypothetical protein
MNISSFQTMREAHVGSQPECHAKRGARLQ